LQPIATGRLMAEIALAESGGLRPAAPPLH